MSKSIKDEFETFVCELLTSYRWVPLLACLANLKTREDVRIIAWLDLVKLIKGLGFSQEKEELYENNIREFIHRNRSWINYTMADFLHYVNKLLPDNREIGGEVYRMSLYHDRMHDQFNFLQWNIDAFLEAGFGGEGELEMLDLGCGTMPYIELFRMANVEGPPSRLSGYTGVDKRTVSERRLEEILENYNSETLNVEFFISDVFDDVPNRIEARVLDFFESVQPNVLFFGESLHCMSTPKYTLSKLLKLLPKIERISVLEPNLDNMEGLSQAFPFHMKLHANGLFVNSKTLSCMATNLGFNMRAVEASSQHTMYHLTRI